jgi:hypothetical protein
MKYEIKDLTLQELQIIYQGLGELPLKVALNVFSKLQMQMGEQDDKNAVPLESLGLAEFAGEQTPTDVKKKSK